MALDSGEQPEEVEIGTNINFGNIELSEISGIKWEDLNGDGDAMDEGEVEPFVTGLSAITDITFGPDGTLYVTVFGTAKQGEEQKTGKMLKIIGKL